MDIVLCWVYYPNVFVFFCMTRQVDYKYFFLILQMFKLHAQTIFKKNVPLICVQYFKWAIQCTEYSFKRFWFHACVKNMVPRWEKSIKHIFRTLLVILWWVKVYNVSILHGSGCGETLQPLMCILVWRSHSFKYPHLFYMHMHSRVLFFLIVSWSTVLK